MVKIKKKIIFFDADGTLWYPKRTKYTKHPVWIYNKYKNLKLARKELVLIPTVFDTLKKLRKLNIKLIILSTSPRSQKEANIILRETVKHFNLSHFFEEIHGTKDYHGSKEEFMLKILKKYNLPKNSALMVGDSYLWDYKPARLRGIDAVLINSDYGHLHGAAKKVKRKINKMEDILKYI